MNALRKPDFYLTDAELTVLRACAAALPEVGLVADDTNRATLESLLRLGAVYTKNGSDPRRYGILNTGRSWLKTMGDTAALSENEKIVLRAVGGHVVKDELWDADKETAMQSLKAAGLVRENKGEFILTMEGETALACLPEEPTKAGEKDWREETRRRISMPRRMKWMSQSVFSANRGQVRPCFASTLKKLCYLRAIRLSGQDVAPQELSTPNTTTICLSTTLPNIHCF
jgi:hypothetical protein